MSVNLLGIIEAAAAVQLFSEATRRISSWLSSITFYGENDQWLFLQSGHPNMCKDCASNNGVIYSGDELRSIFPYHVILDTDTIAAYVHPNCTCLLLRAIPEN